MREIKFRAWSFDTVLEEPQMLSHEDLDKLDREGLEHLFDIINGKDKYIIPMQFTGLKDKNGVEIYEGDILYFQTYQGGGFIKSGIDCYAEVVYGEYNFTDNFLNKGIGFYLLTGKTQHPTSIGYWLDSHKAIVIGNIYQHKHVL